MNGYREENVTRILSYVEIASNRFCWRMRKKQWLPAVSLGTDSGQIVCGTQFTRTHRPDSTSWRCVWEREREKKGGEREGDGNGDGEAGRPAGGSGVDVVPLDFLTWRTGFNRPRSRFSRCRPTGHVVHHRSSRTNSNVFDVVFFYRYFQKIYYSRTYNISLTRKALPVC